MAPRPQRHLGRNRRAAGLEQYKNVKWKVALPDRGNSSRVTWRPHLYSRGEGKEKSGTYCFDRATGRRLSERVDDIDEEDPTHATNPYCGSSPAIDGQKVVVWHGSAGVHCYDYDGKIVWSRNLGLFRHIWGYGSSPVFHDGRILLNCGPGKRQFIIALNPADGTTLWQTDIPGGTSARRRRRWRVDRLLGHAHADHRRRPIADPSEHSESASTFNPPQQQDPVDLQRAGQALLHRCHRQRQGWRDDRKLTVRRSRFALAGRGTSTESNRLWRAAQQNPQRIGSGVILGKHIFMANEPGIAQCLDLESGEERWKTRLPGGNIWSSLIAAEGRLYVTTQGGKTVVSAANPEAFELLQNDVHEQTNSTLALSNGQIFLARSRICTASRKPSREGRASQCRSFHCTHPEWFSRNP